MVMDERDRIVDRRLGEKEDPEDRLLPGAPVRVKTDPPCREEISHSERHGHRRNAEDVPAERPLGVGDDRVDRDGGDSGTALAELLKGDARPALGWRLVEGEVALKAEAAVRRGDLAAARDLLRSTVEVEHRREDDALGPWAELRADELQVELVE